jgi:HK97 family phage major capsid protein
MGMTREQFPIVNTGALFFPALAKRVVELTMPNLALKPLLQDFFIKTGATASIPKQKGNRATAVVGKTAEGTEIIADFTPYESITVTPYKVGMRVRVTRELIEDQIVNIVEDQLRRAARRVVMTIDQDVEKALNAGALTSTATTGTSTFMDGTPGVFPHTIGVSDITNSKQVIQNYMLEPDTIAMNPIAHQDLASLPQFAALLFYGQPVYAQGSGTVVSAPQLYGLKQIVTANIPTGTGTANTGRAYILAAAGSNYSASYAPLGYFATKRPISVDVWPQPTYDSLDVVITSRYAPVITYPESIVKLTSLRSS